MCVCVCICVCVCKDIAIETIHNHEKKFIRSLKSL